MSERKFNVINIVTAMLSIVDVIYLDVVRSNDDGDMPFSDDVKIVRVTPSDPNCVNQFDMTGIKATDPSGLEANLDISILELKAVNDALYYTMNISVSINGIVTTQIVQALNEDLYVEFKRLIDRIENKTSGVTIN